MVQFVDGKKAPWKVQFRDHTGKVKSKSFSKKDTATKFEGKVRLEREHRKAGLPTPIDEILFIDLVKSFIKKREIERPRSFEMDASRLNNHWVETFGPRPVKFIATEEISKRLDDLLEDGHSPASRNRNRAVMHTFFEYAIKKKKALYNPVSSIELLSEKKKSRKVSYWENPNDAEKYVEAAYQIGLQFKIPLGFLSETLLFQGPRISEALALQNRDIDLKRGFIIIRKTLDRKGFIFQGTKGQKEGGEYLIPILPRFEHAYAAHLERTQMAKPNDYLFTNLDGSFFTYYQYANRHDEIIKLAEVEYNTIHDFRRFFATYAEDHGIARGDVQTMLGHSSIVTTENYIRKNMTRLIERVRSTGFGAVPTRAEVISIKAEAGRSGK